MNCDPFKPSSYMVETRRTAISLLTPGRMITEAAVARLMAEINTSIAIAREYEDEMSVLQDMLMPKRSDPPAVYSTAKVIPIRRRPALRVVGSPTDGGDAA